MNETVSLYRSELDIGTHKINVTTRRLSIVGLRHYTQYQIWVGVFVFRSEVTHL